MNRTYSFFLTVLLTLQIAGCNTTPKVSLLTGGGSSYISDVPGTNNLSILSAIGGLSLIGGIILLVVTAGRRGWYPIVAGLCLVVLNYMVSKYDDWLFIPLVVCTVVLGLVWTYKIVKQILLEKKSK